MSPGERDPEHKSDPGYGDEYGDGESSDSAGAGQPTADQSEQDAAGTDPETDSGVDFGTVDPTIDGEIASARIDGILEQNADTRYDIELTDLTLPAVLTLFSAIGIGQRHYAAEPDAGDEQVAVLGRIGDQIDTQADGIASDLRKNIHTAAVAEYKQTYGLGVGDESGLRSSERIATWLDRLFSPRGLERMAVIFALMYAGIAALQFSQLVSATITQVGLIGVGIAAMMAFTAVACAHHFRRKFRSDATAR